MMLENESVLAAVVAGDGVRILDSLSDVNASALLACVADDPACWDDLALLWPRNRFDPENAEFFEGLPVRPAELDAACEALKESSAWFAIDLIGRRLLTGGNHVHVRLLREPRSRDETECETIVMPPWWDLHRQAAPSLLLKRRVPPEIPDPHREVLWGPPLTQYIASRIVSLVRAGESWIARDRGGDPCGDYDLTVLIHRDWLMTPNPLLGGVIPRDLLHVGKDWIADLADGQRFRIFENESPVPVSPELSTYARAPMGRHEVILYFDGCRETIDAGWRWLMQDPDRIEEHDVERQLASAMDDFLADWLGESSEDGLSPAEVIQCDRLRVPLVEGGDHMSDCDCPICEMLASGMLGPGFIHFDGHQLELDDEFAFSLCATREEWDWQQGEWAEMDARIEAKSSRGADQDKAGDDDFAPVWTTTLVANEGIPGDSSGHLQLAFLVSDLVGSLKVNHASQADVDALNAAFRDYRKSVVRNGDEAAAEFKQTLQQLSEQHAYLVSRCADLQSRIDERLRASNADDLGASF